MDSIELMFVRLATGSEVVLDSMFFPIVFCNIGGHAITQYVSCQIINKM